MNLFKVLLVLHIAGGSISLLTGSLVLLFKKGGKVHRVIGNIYFFSLLTASLVSFPMSVMHTNYFLFIIGVFSTYMLLTGKAYLSKQQLPKVRVIDWIWSVLMMVAGIGFMITGCLDLLANGSFGVVPIVFGLISLAFVFQDWANFTGRSGLRNYWLTTHLQRMIGSYIASATAFLVVNNHVLPGVIAWLLPTVVLSPLIGVWTKKYRVKTLAP